MIVPVYYASGSSRPADIRGFAAVGHAIGVAAPELSPNAIAELVALRGRGIPVFVDSGAFSEIEFTAAGPVVVRPITRADWRARLALYHTLAQALGGDVALVAPDRIGDQEHTLALLTEFAGELRELAALGAKILVPIQKGTRSQAEFARDVAAVLAFDFVHAIPSKKNATTMDELDAFMRDVKPARVHLLGLGIKNANASRALGIIEKRSPGCVVSLDSNLIAANVGRGSKPRLLTRCRDEAAKLIASGRTFLTSSQELGIILAFGNSTAQAAVVFSSAA